MKRVFLVLLLSNTISLIAMKNEQITVPFEPGQWSLYTDLFPEIADTVKLTALEQYINYLKAGEDAKKRCDEQHVEPSSAHIVNKPTVSKTYSCHWDGCERQFENEFDQLTHTRMEHLNIRFTCAHCNKTFPYEYLLKSHVKEHDNIPLSCLGTIKRRNKYIWHYCQNKRRRERTTRLHRYLESPTLPE